MRYLKKTNTAMAVIGLSSVLFMSQSFADTNTTDSMEKLIQSFSSIVDLQNSVNNTDKVSPMTDGTRNTNKVSPMTNGDRSTGNVNAVTNGVSQQLTGDSKTANSLNKFLPTIKYNTENLPKMAQQVNAASWTAGTNIDRVIGTKLQALLNWHHSGVGPVDGYWGKNTRKAMQAFQKAQGLEVTNTLNEETWQALTASEKLTRQPVLVNYKLTDNDIYIKTTTIPAGAEAKAKLDGMYYESVLEGVAEKFHMNEKYLKSLNPKASFSVGETITVYNPGNPSTKPVSRVVADKATETLYTYDDENNFIASYPTTVGSTATPSPTGTHKVAVKVHEPNYTYTHDDGSKSVIPPGPNNPVGVVWIGLSEPTYGIHGSPDPARISRQASAGCVRLTNWDALALLGTINSDATVEFQ